MSSESKSEPVFEPKIDDIHRQLTKDLSIMHKSIEQISPDEKNDQILLEQLEALLKHKNDILESISLTIQKYDQALSIKYKVPDPNEFLPPHYKTRPVYEFIERTYSVYPHPIYMELYGNSTQASELTAELLTYRQIQIDDKKSE